MTDSIAETMTVVVPVRNRPQLILRTLDSIKAQTWRPLRVIVVDNGSDDDTPERVRRWMEQNGEEDFECTLLEEPSPGPSVARNSGLREVTTRLMMHFDSDDIMRPGHIETIMRRFEAPDHPDLVCFRIHYHTLGGRAKVNRAPGGSLMQNHLVHSLLCTIGYACETALIRRAGGWNINLRCWEDYELGVRLLLESRQRAYIKDVNAEAFSRMESVTGPNFIAKEGEWEKALDEVERTLEQSLHKDRKKWIKYVAYRRAVLAAHYKREGHPETASRLMGKALGQEGLSSLQRAYLKTVFKYTAAGGRGASLPSKLIF